MALSQGFFVSACIPLDVGFFASTQITLVNMPEKDPTTWNLATWALAFAMASFGGMVNWYARVRKGQTRVFNIIELLGEIFTSAFVGISVFMLFAAFDQPMALCAAAAGIGGNMSTRLLLAVERVLESKTKKIERKDSE